MKKRIRITWEGDEKIQEKIVMKITPNSKVFKVWDNELKMKKYIIEKEFENGNKNNG